MIGSPHLINGFSRVLKRLYRKQANGITWRGAIDGQRLSWAPGKGEAFRKGRDCQLGISKRGGSYLRTLLVHGARAVLRYADGKDDDLSSQPTSRRAISLTQ